MPAADFHPLRGNFLEFFPSRPRTRNVAWSFNPLADALLADDNLAMRQFNPADPFPVVDPASYTKRDASLHSCLCDSWLRFKINEIEKQLADFGCRKRAPEASGEKQQLWMGLDPQDLQTPYLEIRWLLEMLRPRPGQIVADLGAGYGRMGFVMARHFPEVQFVGYEYVGERVLEARRCLEKFGARNARMVHADLASVDFTPAVADFYFLYDFGTPKAIEKVLHDLRRMADSKPIVLISRGRQSRYIIESRHPWLTKANPSAAEGRTTVYLANAQNASVERRSNFLCSMA
jgi:SAM-dependent methyltransferase